MRKVPNKKACPPCRLVWVSPSLKACVRLELLSVVRSHSATMWSSLLLCWWVLLGIQVAAGTAQGGARVEEHGASASGTGRHAWPSLPRPARALSLTGDRSLSKMDPDRLSTESEEAMLVENIGLFDEEAVSEAVELQSRAVRSPRRCVRHQESCLGHQLPCCDPCDTCYCRFFNAICYCRRVSKACPHGRHQ
ncbi:AGRP protein, partial [Atractosteus spatula]|nr:AGRP protein [Atractosteus spatula]